MPCKRVAALYDIHGNLPALEAVGEELRRAGVDRVVVGGDVLPGPMPRAALEWLLALDLPTQFIHGNGDRVVLAQMRGMEPIEVPEQFRETVRWTARQLEPEHERLLGEWPSTATVDIEGLGPVLFCHATPRNDVDCFTRLTPAERLAPIFSGLDAAVGVCGHTHMQFDRMLGDIRVVNAGSVGMPFGAAGADWLVLGPGVDLRHTHYDLERAADRLRQTAYPQEGFVEHYILHPPSEQQMMAAFTDATFK